MNSTEILIRINEIHHQIEMGEGNVDDLNKEKAILESALDHIN